MRISLTRRRNTGLVHIWCSECQRDLSWAQAEFAARHPKPVCGRCRSGQDEQAAEAAERHQDIADLGQATASALLKLTGRVPALENNQRMVIDGVVQS